MSAFDTVYGSFDAPINLPTQPAWESDWMPSTVSPELPTDVYYAAPRESVIPAVGNSNDSDWSLSGILKTAASTGNDLVKAWGGIQGVRIAADQQALNAQLARGDITVRSAQATNAVEVAKLQTEAQKEIEIARAGAAVSKAKAEADAARNASTVVVAGQKIDPKIVIGLLALAVAVYGTRRAKGAK